MLAIKTFTACIEYDTDTKLYVVSFPEFQVHTPKALLWTNSVTI